MTDPILDSLRLERDNLEREFSAARETIAALRGRAEKAERDLGGALETRPDRARMFDCEAWDGAMDALGKTQSRAVRAEQERDRLAVALREVTRRARLPITPNVSGLPNSEEETAAAIAQCVRLALDHVIEPALPLSALLSPAPAATPKTQPAVNLAVNPKEER